MGVEIMLEGAREAEDTEVEIAGMVVRSFFTLIVSWLHTATELE
jgi:hypothetical protein